MIKIKEFGNILKNIRLANNLSQEDVEFLAGMSIRSLSRLENGTVTVSYTHLTLPTT